MRNHNALRSGVPPQCTGTKNHNALRSGVPPRCNAKRTEIA